MMLKRISNGLFKILPAILFLMAFKYVFDTVEPKLIFHHIQPAFLVSSDFVKSFLSYPGGIAELVSAFIMQAFYYRYLGTIVFFVVAVVFYVLVFFLLNEIHKNKLNLIFSFVPFLLSIVMANNYNFPFSITISIVFVLLFLLLLLKIGKGLFSYLSAYILGALLIYYFAGSGYLMLFSLASIFLFHHNKWQFRIYVSIFIAVFAFAISWFAVHSIFALPLDYTYFYFFTPRLYFIAFKPETVFYILILSVPILIILYKLIIHFNKNQNFLQNAKYQTIPSILGYSVIAGLVFYCHQITFNPDEKKIIEADYYSYHNNAGKTEIAATTLKNYSFEANLNYNLVISKTGNLPDKFFNFFQISGTSSLFPDNRFQSEMSFIAADYYYNLGFISEARHWAYESLVNFPHSIRALQLLVKIHLILHEYSAAERCLNILNKGIIDKRFVLEFTPLIMDTTLVNSNKEITEKRSFIPAERELSTTIKQRLQELMEANNTNKNAYEHLMLYYLLDADLESFMNLYADAEKFYEKPVRIFEEAVLMYGVVNNIQVESEYNITAESVKKFNDFKQKLMKYKGDTRLAMNELYPEFGSTYIFYLQLIYPRILKPENLMEDDELPAI